MFGLYDVIDGLSPETVSGGEINVVMHSNKELWVENYKGIGSICENEIVLKGKRYSMIIGGEDMWIEYYTKESMRIHGKICGIVIQECNIGNIGNIDNLDNENR